MKFYLEETKQVLSGKDTMVVAKEMGVSHSTISLRVRKTLTALKNYFGIEETLFTGVDVKEARGNSAYWLTVIKDYEYAIKPKEESENDYKYFEMLKVVAGAYVAKNGLPDDVEIENLKTVARKLL